MQNFMKAGSMSRFFFFIAGILLAQGCNTQPDKVADEKQKYIIPDTVLRSLKIDTVQKGALVNDLTLTGKVTTNDDNVSKIYPLVSGKIRDIKVALGDYVNKGQTLAVMNSTEMAGYSADLVNAEAGLSVAKKNMEATQDMYKSGIASQKDLLSAETDYQKAQSELGRVKRVLNINGGNTGGEYVITSPISGFVVEKLVTNNTMVRADAGTQLFTISDLKNVWIMANVYESNIGQVHMGDNVEVTTLSYPGKVFHGTVDKMYNVLDPTNKVMKVRIVMSNEDYSLKPEMFASIRVVYKDGGQALSIPSSALIFDNSRYYVLIYHSKSDVKITPVSVINSIGDRTYISAGVNAGDQVIASQAILIYDALNN
ncbi:cobalt-zinc-cadmium efflux system membrane fusion protein [Chitinophaga polysaccharea]|uniref:Cobalt-zinc-cadmium efflux system membrane fusion protein n=1 Tax=Chitinophaga polysaccharea TaxID=1293035 RepID=A0A561P9P3_9BACT|nr:efflux RND transporter periplasmic adaptor subunit [Chitinophaga polysaccharea]TWF34853.1 cobalt-zinc-cadmium efflux system membrane fusion protein [Chitinophaga polysaccharea]